jgi:hypothetical protein
MESTMIVTAVVAGIVVVIVAVQWGSVRRAQADARPSRVCSLGGCPSRRWSASWPATNQAANDPAHLPVHAGEGLFIRHFELTRFAGDHSKRPCTILGGRTSQRATTQSSSDGASPSRNRARPLSAACGRNPRS